MSPARDAPIKVFHVYVAVASVLIGMFVTAGGILWTASGWQSTVNERLGTVASSVDGLRNELSAVAKQVQSNTTTNAVQDTKIDRLEKDVRPVPVLSPRGATIQ